MTPHETAIQEFLKENPKWQRYELRRKLNNIFRHQPIHALGFIPDAFHIDKRTQTVNLLEVDGSSRLDTHKLRLICELWYVLDELGWSCTLTTIHLPAKTMSYMADGRLCRHWNDFIEQESRQARRAHDALA